MAKKILKISFLVAGAIFLVVNLAWLIFASRCLQLASNVQYNRIRGSHYYADYDEKLIYRGFDESDLKYLVFGAAGQIDKMTEKEEAYENFVIVYEFLKGFSYQYTYHAGSKVPQENRLADGENTLYFNEEKELLQEGDYDKYELFAERIDEFFEKAEETWGGSMKTKKIAFGILIACVAVVLVYTGIWGAYWLRCNKLRNQMLEVYGTDNVKLDDGRIALNMPRLGRFDSSITIGTFIDEEEQYSKEHLIIPTVKVCFGAFGGIIIASECTQKDAIGMDELGRYTYSTKVEYLELDETLQPIDEKSAEVWERVKDSYDGVFDKINHVWDFIK